MPIFLTEELSSLRSRARGDAWQQCHDWAGLAEEAAEMAALALHLLRRIEHVAGKRQPDDPAAWDEAAAREFVPLFKEWFDYATTVRDLVRACREHGHPVEDVTEFLHGYNRAKMMALDFDDLVESRRRIERGESRGIPLQRLLDELRDRP